MVVPNIKLKGRNMITDHFKSRGYQILAQRPECPLFWVGIDGIAQFLYKGYQISMSTMGRSQGGSMHPVCVFKPGNAYQDIAKDGFNTVQEAIEWIDKQTKEMTDIFNLETNVLFCTIVDQVNDKESIYARTFRQYLIDKNISAEQFNTCVKEYLAERPIIDPKLFIALMADNNMTANNFITALYPFQLL